MDGPGFAGWLEAGESPAAAYRRIRAQAQQPDVRALIAELESTEAGRAALAYSRARWSAYGFEPPWEGLADPGYRRADR